MDHSNNGLLLDFSLNGAQSLDLQNYLKCGSSTDFPEKGDLVIHRPDIMEFACNTCERKFNTFSELQTHRILHGKLHKNIESKAQNRRRKVFQFQNPSVGNNIRSADVCEESISVTSQGIEPNIESHFQMPVPNELICHCGFAAKSKGGLKLHKKIHRSQQLNALSTTTAVNQRDMTSDINVSQHILNTSQTTSLRNLPNSDEDVNLLSCHLCPASNRKKYKGNRGLNLHIKRKHQSTSVAVVDTSQDISTSLANLKANVRVLKRIPKGARYQAATRITVLINNCLHEPNNLENWRNLLTFPYVGLRLPEKKNLKGTLTSMVKRNLDAELHSQDEIVVSSYSKETSLSRRVEAKIADGDVKGAVRLLISEDTIAPMNEDTYLKLLEKHPPPSRTMNFTDEPNESTPSLNVESDVVKNSIFSFPAGSSSGVDGFRPQHLKDLLSSANGDASSNLLISITNLCNFMLAGRVPESILPILYGANLCALNKKCGGIRPIAIGNCFRRLTAKLACSSVCSSLSLEFQPRQLGFATNAGCETIVHSVRTFIELNANNSKILLLIDFANAFNTIDRDAMLAQVKIKTPYLYKFLWQAYYSSTYLFFGNKIIASQTGCQQGDPAGPMLFCLTINQIISELLSDLVLFYLDDGTIAGDAESVLKDFENLIEKCRTIGLQINPSKCQLFFTSQVDQNVVNSFNMLSPGINITKDLTLLGAPITTGAGEQCFAKKRSELQLMFARLRSLRSCHISFYLLRNCFAIPKLTYLLRSCPNWFFEHHLTAIDLEIRSCLESVINNKMNDNQWLLASLPIRLGGLGIRRTADIGLSAFLSSVNSVSPLLGLMLNFDRDVVESTSFYNDALKLWNTINNNNVPQSTCNQKNWDSINSLRLWNSILITNDLDKARRLAMTRSESHFWLYALPARSIGTLLENNHFRICVGLRLGCSLCVRHRCTCGDMVLENGVHGLSCIKSAGRIPRHREFNNTIGRTLNTVHFPSQLEPPGLFRSDNKRVDGITLVSWSNGKCLTWDATCADTFAPSYVHTSSRNCGVIAEKSARLKHRLYSPVTEQNFMFVPVAVETMGPWCQEARSFLDSLGRLLIEKTGDPRSKSFLFQRISLTIQRGNAMSIMGTLPHGKKLDEIYNL